MKALATALISVLATALVALGAKPLTPAEKQVCRSLSHCLEIVERHPQDSFDYSVLAHQFEAFGDRGTRSLLKMLRRSRDAGNRSGNRSGNRAASHAADLLALIGTESTLSKLRGLGYSEANARLIRRTADAIESRLEAKPRSMRPALMSKPVQGGFGCDLGKSVALDHRRHEMPFFEADIATPDRYGAFRPSAAYDSPLAFSSRAHLVSARPVPGGWLAAYPDGLIQYDNDKGRPTLAMRGAMIGLQPQFTDRLSEAGWVFMAADNGRTQILAMTGTEFRQVATLPARLSHLRRASDSMLIALDEKGSVLTLRSDATATPGCQSPHD